MALAALLAVAAVVSFAAARAAREGASTRGDLDLLRRRVALLECELALARSRKPYLIVDAPGHRLLYGLLGMTVREIPAGEIRIDGLKRAPGAAPAPVTLAGIMTLKEKENDPRLAPLTPEQIEAGASDENVADALPPEAPADFRVQLNQPVALRVEGVPEKDGVFAGATGFWRRLLPGGNRGGSVALRLTVHVEETAAREMYRSLVPGYLLALVAPTGYVFQDAALESPRAVKPGRPARFAAPPPGSAPQGVPFVIPPPVPEGAAGEAGSTGEAAEPASEGASTPAVEATPEPAPGPSDPRETPPEPQPEPPHGAPPSGSAGMGGGA